MWGDKTQSSEGGTGEAQLGALTTTHTRSPKAPLGSVGAQHRGKPTGGALPPTVLYIQYEHIRPQERQQQ